MERLSEEQYREVIAEIKHSELPRKTQEFLIALVNEANKPNKKIIEWKEKAYEIRKVFILID